MTEVASTAIDAEFRDVASFNKKFDLPVKEGAPKLLGAKAMRDRLKFMNEELDELKEAVALRDMVAQCDALVDLVYVIKGTAVMMGIPWEQVWAAVQESNMNKINTGVSVDHKIGIAKPAGWVSPEPKIAKILRTAGYQGAL